MKRAYRVAFFQTKASLRDKGREKLIFKEELVDLLGAEPPRRDPQLLPA